MEQLESTAIPTKKTRVGLFSVILVLVLIISSIRPFSIITSYIGLPLQQFSGINRKEAQFDKDMAKATQDAYVLFPISQEFCGTDEACKKQEEYNQQQQMKAIEHRKPYWDLAFRVNALTPLQTLIKQFSGQITIILLFVLFGFIHLLFKKKSQ